MGFWIQTSLTLILFKYVDCEDEIVKGAGGQTVVGQRCKDILLIL
jgi:hypothetical protein